MNSSTLPSPYKNIDPSVALPSQIDLHSINPFKLTMADIDMPWSIQKYHLIYWSYINLNVERVAKWHWWNYRKLNSSNAP